MTLNQYFDKIICINLQRRYDRWMHVESECSKHNITLERFEAIDMHDWGNDGCTASHHDVLKMISESMWNRVLVLEDDFEFRFPNAQDMFSNMLPQVPQDWWMLYLGGHYGGFENTRISENIVQFKYMKTTSSYGVTRESASAMWEGLTGTGPIDEHYHGWHRKKPCYIFSPRLAIQYHNLSDLSKNAANHGPCMEDQTHENSIGIYH